MKPFEIFKAGTHISAGGDKITFSDDDLQKAVAAYNADLHEAPIVVGHPKDNHPAFGWISKIEYADGAIIAHPAQVADDFAELVQAGRYKKRSASFYTPDAPNNPTPGAYYLRHVGFLGAQPPAVKGLRGVEFNEAEAGVLEFADSGMVAGMIAQFARRVREWIISTEGVEAADKVAPDYLVSGLEEQARAPAEMERSVAYADPVLTDPALDNAIADPSGATPIVDPALVEPTTQTGKGNKPQPQKETPLMNTDADYKANADAGEIGQLQAEIARLQKTLKNFEEREAAIVAKEAEFAEAAAKATRAQIETRIDAAIAAGRALPAKRDALVEYAVGLADAEAVAEFGEGDDAEKVSQREFFLRGIEANPVQVSYGEKATPTAKENENLTPDELAKRTREYREAEKAKGNIISVTQAAEFVNKGISQ